MGRTKVEIDRALEAIASVRSGAQLGRCPVCQGWFFTHKKTAYVLSIGCQEAYKKAEARRRAARTR